MKAFKIKSLTLCVCLVVTMIFTIETNAQALENANFQAGITAYQANNLPLAYKEFHTAAKDGHADSQFNVALMYEQGIGVSKDEKEAVVWYGKSAAQGNAAAQFNLGVLYENGRGTKIDYVKANELYRKASAQGDPLAIGNLGMLYVRGQGVKENKVAGVALLLVSAAMDPSPQNHRRWGRVGTPGTPRRRPRGSGRRIRGRCSRPSRCGCRRCRGACTTPARR